MSITFTREPAPVSGECDTCGYTWREGQPIYKGMRVGSARRVVICSPECSAPLIRYPKVVEVVGR